MWLITKPIPILLFAVFFLYPYFFHTSEQPYIIIIFIENVFDTCSHFFYYNNASAAIIIIIILMTHAI